MVLALPVKLGLGLPTIRYLFEYTRFEGLTGLIDLDNKQTQITI